MSQRITDKDLEWQVDDICRSLNQERGQYWIQHAYGGVQFQRKEDNGCSDVFSTGYCTKRELIQQLSAFRRGILELKRLQSVPDSGKEV